MNRLRDTIIKKGHYEGTLMPKLISILMILYSSLFIWGIYLSVHTMSGIAFPILIPLQRVALFKKAFVKLKSSPW